MAAPADVLTLTIEVPPPVSVPAFWVNVAPAVVEVPALMVKIPVFNVTGAEEPIREKPVAMPLLSRLMAPPAWAVKALLFNADGLRVAAVDDSGHVHLHKVSIYRDYGTKIELREGLKGGERVALSPPADITEGQKVKVAAQPADAKGAAKK